MWWVLYLSPTSQAICYYPWVLVYSYLRWLFFPQRVGEFPLPLSFRNIPEWGWYVAATFLFQLSHVLPLSSSQRGPPYNHRCALTKGSRAMGVDHREDWANLLLSYDSAQADVYCHWITQWSRRPSRQHIHYYLGKWHVLCALPSHVVGRWHFQFHIVL